MTDIAARRQFAQDAVARAHVRIDDIECLRAIAILSVLVQHVDHNLISWDVGWIKSLVHYAGLWAGVDLFFAISGFVIARSLLPQLRATVGTRTTLRTLAAFWTRRVFRLWPSAWLWLAVILVAVAFFNRSGVFGGLASNLWAAAAAAANVANIRLAHYFMSVEAGSSAVYWSLSLEEQFYLVLPLLALLFRRYLPAVLLLLIGFQAWRGDHTFLSIMIRTDALAWGVLLAMAYGSVRWKRVQPVWMESRLARWLTLGLLLCVLGYVAGYANEIRSAHKTSLVAVLVGALVWIASYDANYILRSAFLKRILLWVGSRSYAIYLIHIPAFLAIREFFWRMEQSGLLEPVRSQAVYFLSAMILIAILAEANYLLVETPFRRMGVRLATRFKNSSDASFPLPVGNP